MLTVVSFLYSSGWRPGAYKPEHARNLRVMLEKHLTIPHRFVLIDDGSIAGDRSELTCLPCWEFPEIPNEDIRRNYVRLRLFHQSCDYLGERVLMLDLDTVIRGNIDHLITNDSVKLLINANGKQFAGAMWLCSPGACDGVWNDLPYWVADAAKRGYTGSDQAVLTAALWGRVPVWDSKGEGIGFSRSVSGVRSYPTPPYFVPRLHRETDLERFDWKIATCSGGLRPWEPDAPLHREYQSAIL